MKRTIYTLIALLLTVTATVRQSNSVKSASALGGDIIYAYLPVTAALYEKTDTAVIESETEEPSEYSVVTMLPATYFVALIGGQDAASDYYFVNYSDISGYILKSSVEVCDYEPVTKYALGSLKTDFDGQNVNLRETPDHTLSGNILLTIPSATNLSYYGTAEGTALYPALGETWYYVRYESESGIRRGYIYNAQVNAQKINENIIERVERPPAQSNDPTIEPTPPAFSDITNIVFIICLCIPAIVIVIMIFKKPSATKRTPRHYRNDEES